MLKLFLWLRYLRKRKIVLLSIAAVALSVALLVVVDSLFNGYIEAIKNSEAANIGDIFLWRYKKPIPKYDVFLERLEELDEVEAAVPFNLGGGLLWLESGDVREVMIQGIEPAREEKFTEWKKSLLKQKTSAGQVGFEVPNYPNDDGCWLGINIVAEPDEKTDEYDLLEAEELIGKQVILTTTGFEGKRKVVKLRVSDIALTQTYFGDQTLYLPLKKLNTITFGDDEAQHAPMTKIKLKDDIDATLIKGLVRDVWEQFATEELGWDGEDVTNIGINATREDREYFAELRKQMGVLLLIFGVICSVAVLLVFCIFYMIVMTKQKDIAIIKSCGATSGAAALIFTGFGACVGIVGSAFGIIIGYIVTRNINALEECIRIVFGMKLWRSSSYILNEIPSQVNWPAVWPIALAAVGGCCLGALIPAIVAARVEPVKILRYE